MTSVCPTHCRESCSANQCADAASRRFHASWRKRQHGPSVPAAANQRLEHISADSAEKMALMREYPTVPAHVRFACLN